MPKKRMIKTLKHVYQQTHQYESDSEYEASFVRPESPRQQSSPVKNVQAPQVGKQSNPKKKTKTAITSKPSSSKNKNVVSKETKNTSVDEVSSSQDSTCSDLDNPVLEETCLIEEAEQPSSSVKGSSKNAEEMVTKFIYANEDLHMKILEYEPLEFADFQKMLKENGIRIGQAKLLDYLDEKCITFTMRKKSKEKPGGPHIPRNRQRRK